MPNKTYRATHRNGTAGADPSKVTTRRGRGFRLKVANTDGANSMEISFDTGKTFFPIGPGATFEEDVAFHFFYVRRVGGVDVDYAAVLFEG